MRPCGVGGGDVAAKQQSGPLLRLLAQVAGAGHWTPPKPHRGSLASSRDAPGEIESCCVCNGPRDAVLSELCAPILPARLLP